MVVLHKERVSGTKSTDFPGHSSNDAEWNLETFKSNTSVSVHNLGDRTANFDLVGVDTSLANAFRRIMLAEVPSVAIEKVFISINTSVVQDEVLASRLGLVPLSLSPDWLDWVESVDPATNEARGETAETVVRFSLEIKCRRNPAAPKTATDPKELYINSNVYARHLKYIPEQSQLEHMDPAPTVADPDILLCKLRPGQEISLECWAVLGVGSDHAKFSPVATASYRLMPEIDLLGDVNGDEAVKLQSLFSPGVIGIRDGAAYVKDPRKDTVSREVLRHKEFDGKVRLGRRRDHFIFNIESVGTMPPEEIFVKSIQHLKNKASVLLQEEV